MTTGLPLWADTPIVASWRRSSSGGISLVTPFDLAAARAEQLDRARELGRALGIKRVTNAHAARIAAMLSVHVPGLRIETPATPTGSAVAVDPPSWTPSAGGRPRVWNDEGLGSLNWAITRVHDRLCTTAAARSLPPPTRKAAIVAYRDAWESQFRAGLLGMKPCSVERIENLIATARRRGLWHVPPPADGITSDSDTGSAWDDPIPPAAS
ncbi:hypothetical protein KOAAANKH_03521 [Brevundimonas sp. NIBR10]|nr:hypothetical protein KOAAANKH_03521 [Brevundimonas sp. NIBR10]